MDSILCVNQALRAPDCPVQGLVLLHHAELTTAERDQHMWSPNLAPWHSRRNSLARGEKERQLAYGLSGGLQVSARWTQRQQLSLTQCVADLQQVALSLPAQHGHRTLWVARYHDADKQADVPAAARRRYGSRDGVTLQWGRRGDGCASPPQRSRARIEDVALQNRASHFIGRRFFGIGRRRWRSIRPRRWPAQGTPSSQRSPTRSKKSSRARSRSSNDGRTRPSEVLRATSKMLEAFP